MGVIFLFIDGIGIDKPGRLNPLSGNQWKSFMELTGGQGLQSQAQPVFSEDLVYTAIDANLGIDGLPQSGTGQVSLFSGKNAAAVLGRHFGPYPHSEIRFLLEKESLFHRVMDQGMKPHFINAYPAVFFEKMRDRNRWTSTTLMAASAGLPLNGPEEIQAGTAVTAGITQNAWREQLGLDVEEISPEHAADRLLKSAGSYDLVMYEYYQTDKAGHAMNREMSEEILTLLDRFICQLLSERGNETTLLICSDHGNLEDLSVKTHTRNPVPLMIRGTRLPEIKKPHSITDVSRIIVNLLNRPVSGRD